MADAEDLNTAEIRELMDGFRLRSLLSVEPPAIPPSKVGDVAITARTDALASGHQNDRLPGVSARCSPLRAVRHGRPLSGDCRPRTARVFRGRARRAELQLETENGLSREGTDRVASRRPAMMSVSRRASRRTRPRLLSAATPPTCDLCACVRTIRLMSARVLPIDESSASTCRASSSYIVSINVRPFPSSREGVDVAPFLLSHTGDTQERCLATTPCVEGFPGTCGVYIRMSTGDETFTHWLEALDERHLANLTQSEATRALRALSSCYVERGQKLASGGPLDSAGKRAAFALFYSPLHFLVTAPDRTRAGRRQKG